MAQHAHARFFEVAPARVALRIAQSAAIVQQAPIVLLGNGLGALIAAMAISRDYPLGAVAAMVAGMWLLLAPVLWSWRRLRRRARPHHVSVSRIYKLTAYSGLLGLYWSACMLYFLPGRQFETVGLLVAGSAFLAIGSASTMYVLPPACLAYVVPITLTSLYVSASYPHPLALPLFLLVLLMSAGTGWTLVASWKSFQANLDLSTQAERLQYEADRARREKSEFFDNVNHEIRTPLSGVIGFAEQLLIERSSLSAPQQTVADNIQHSARLLLRMVNDLLETSSTAARHEALRFSDFDVRGMLEDVSAVVSLEAQAKGVEVELQVSRTVPWRISADAARLAQVLLNLMGYAIRCTPGGVVTVRAEYDRYKGLLHLSLPDAGPGMASPQLERIFLRFPHLGQPSAQTDGAGLGLFACRKQVGLMGGRIEASSQAGQASSFHVWLPAVAVDAQQAPRGTAALQAPPETFLAGSSSGARAAQILAVDDSPQNLLLISMMLSRMGYTPVTAADGYEAVALCKERLFDLILMDIEMPGMDGIAATHAIRAGINEETPVLAVTGYSSEATLQRIGQAGMKDCIHKPLSSKVLHAAIVQWMAALPPAPAGAALPQAELQPDAA